MDKSKVVVFTHKKLMNCLLMIILMSPLLLFADGGSSWGNAAYISWGSDYSSYISAGENEYFYGYMYAGYDYGIWDSYQSGPDIHYEINNSSFQVVCSSGWMNVTDGPNGGGTNGANGVFFTCPATGYYYIRAWSHNSSQTGSLTTRTQQSSSNFNLVSMSATNPLAFGSTLTVSGSLYNPYATRWNGSGWAWQFVNIYINGTKATSGLSGHTFTVNALGYTNFTITLPFSTTNGATTGSNAVVVKAEMMNPYWAYVNTSWSTSVNTSNVAPTVTTQAMSSITQSSATGNGNITALGSPNPTQYGHCWSTSANPTTSNSKTTLGTASATGAFTSSLTDLTANTLYYVKAYATNLAGTVYGDQVSFTTTIATPGILSPTDVTSNSFNARWSAVTGATGYYLDVSHYANFSDPLYNNVSVGNVTEFNVTGCTNNWVYYYRVRSSNANSTSLSSDSYSVTVMTGTTQNNHPANLSTGVSITPTLSWSAPGEGANGYKVYLGTDAAATNLVNGPAQTELTYDTPTLAYNTVYYWKIVPYTAAGDATGISIISFTTIDQIVVPLDPVVTDFGPVNTEVTIPDVTGAVTVDVAVTWAPVITGMPNAGLDFQLSSPTLTFPGRTITITHNLGYIPSQIVYRILPGQTWVSLFPDGGWNNTSITFSLPSSKADGDLEVVFPKEEGQTLAVELSSFTAVLTSNNTAVRVCWVSESETDHLGYQILRGESNQLSDAVQINNGFITNGIQTGTLTDYSYLDNEVESNSAYYYWLLSVNYDASSQIFGPVMVTVSFTGENPPPEIPIVTQLMNAFPNPFNPTTRISYVIKDPQSVQIEIFDIRGEKVKTFSTNHAVGGDYSVIWDGTDERGTNVGSGCYYYRMTSGKYSNTKKMILLK